MHYIYNYTLHKLEQPYTDDCINYARMEFSSLLNAISTCINEYTMKYSNILHESKVIRKNDTKYLNYSITKNVGQGDEYVKLILTSYTYSLHKLHIHTRMIVSITL